MTRSTTSGTTSPYGDAPCVSEPEHYRSGPIDYGSWPFATALARSLSEGQVRADALGLGVDPLTLATDLIVTVAFDAPIFDHLFARLVDTNSEGQLVWAPANSRCRGSSVRPVAGPALRPP